mmetsp:Transcript_3733/g.8653  ORF Transcript_3733/g.8653 Transcript_3733/m.8653 type:complete len:254 (-) Transcript_3733:216-977(-)
MLHRFRGGYQLDPSRLKDGVDEVPPLHPHPVSRERDAAARRQVQQFPRTQPPQLVRGVARSAAGHPPPSRGLVRRHVRRELVPANGTGAGPSEPVDDAGRMVDVRAREADDAIAQAVRLEADAALAVGRVDQILRGDGDGGEGAEGPIGGRGRFHALFFSWWRCCLLLRRPATATTKDPTDIASDVAGHLAHVVAELRPIHVAAAAAIWLVRLWRMLAGVVTTTAHVEGIAKEVHYSQAAIECAPLSGVYSFV